MTVLDTLVARPAPLQMDAEGVIRVGGTRVRLDTVLGAFNAGSSPEEVVLKYPSLHLTDVYAVVTYYLWHREEVDAYLEEGSRRAEEVRRENETRFPADGVRERLLARRATP